ncbi:Hypothetical predicted protein [Olea europaea subsp. europaea]|uniref:Uncharacterized protein n=1 Tax=Olea europaea subsp. europaea TaxID=158383 RepID=A0A8S0PL36_OLEEU|nr:Hypothetical predicted protein [Olea europaea subsp. europaea]
MLVTMPRKHSLDNHSKHASGDTLIGGFSTICGSGSEHLLEVDRANKGELSQVVLIGPDGWERLLFGADIGYRFQNN